MRQMTALVRFVVLAAFCSNAALAQDSSRLVVSLGLTYNPNIKPNVVVPKLQFSAGDSVRAILQRDFSNGDRIDVVLHTDSIVLPANGAPDYAIFQQLGANFIVQVNPLPSGIRVSLHEVGTKRVAGAKDFLLAGIANSYEWRYAVHGVSDVLQEWMTGELGIAQTRIAFSRGDHLYVIDSDGVNERLVERATSGGFVRSPAWHPTEAILAFSSYNGTAHRIGMKPLAGGTTKWMTNDRDGSNISPAFSPQGIELYYARQDDKGGNIWAVTIATLLKRSLMQSDARTTSPAVSPDGRSIVFVSDATGNPALYTMGKDGASPTNLVKYQSRTYLESPSWSPDGNTIAYSARRGSENLYQIETMDVRSRNPELRTSQGENEDPSWAPDSRHLVFVSKRTGITQLWIFDTKTARARQLTHGTGGVINTPAWSPRIK